MAIVQISQISNRKGLQINLPQLVGGELGWSTDTRRLFIGNGTLEEGAPVIGNTEILTEFSNIFQLQTSTATLQNNIVSSEIIFTESSIQYKAFTVDYTIIRGTGYRTGTLVIATDNGGSVSYSDEYVENTSTGIALTVTQTGTSVNINYTSTNSGQIGSITYYVQQLA